LERGDVLEAQLHVVCNCVFKWFIMLNSRGQIADVIGGPSKMGGSPLASKMPNLSLHVHLLYKLFST
jgi:hypothetical protein